MQVSVEIWIRNYVNFEDKVGSGGKYEFWWKFKVCDN